MNRSAPTLVASVLLAPVLTLGGCAVYLPPGQDQPAATATAQGVPHSEDCSTGQARLTETGRSYLITIGCDRVVIEGSRIGLTAENIGVLEIRGSDNEVSAHGIAELLFDGNDNVVVTSGPRGRVTDLGQGNRIAIP